MRRHPSPHPQTWAQPQCATRTFTAGLKYNLVTLASAVGGAASRGLGASGFCTPSLALPHIKNGGGDQNVPRRHFRKKRILTGHNDCEHRSRSILAAFGANI